METSAAIRSTRAMLGRKKAEGGSKLPQKRFFRQRAHCNPLSFNDAFDYPAHPSQWDWTPYYPRFATKEGEKGCNGGIKQPVEFLDIGCGFGGLTVELARLRPKKLVMGMEIRDKVKEYVRLKLLALRADSDHTSHENASVMRTNCMKFLPNYFEKGQLEKIFICFPDPHFKTKNHRRRIVTQQLLTEYAHFLKPNGILYTITDVKELHEWMARHGEEHAAYARIPNASLEGDEFVRAITEVTEEGKKVARNKGSKYVAVFRRVTPAEADAAAAAGPFFPLPSPATPRAAPAPKVKKKSKKHKRSSQQAAASADTATPAAKKPRTTA